MTRYIVGRLLQGLILLFIVSLVTFLLIHAAPGGPAVLVSPEIGKEQMEQMRANLGLDQPIHVQYLRWLDNTLHGELGKSLSQGLPVLELVLQRLPATLTLSFSALAVAVVVAIPLGIVSAVGRRTFLDNLSTVVGLFGLSVPTFWMGTLLIIVFAVQFRLLPSGGMYTLGSQFSVMDRIRYLAMPTLVLSLFSMAQLARYTRSAVATVLAEDYVRTARSKGLAETLVLSRHVLRNAIIPVVTVVGLMLPHLVGGAAVVETVFAWPGMGRLAVEAAYQRDYPLMMGITLFVSGAVILSNLFVDILYTMLDPRVKLE